MQPVDETTPDCGSVTLQATLTVPVFQPLIVTYGYDPVWFAIIVVITTTPRKGPSSFTPEPTAATIELARMAKRMPTRNPTLSCAAACNSSSTATTPTS